MLIAPSDDPNDPLQLELELFEVGEVLSRNGAPQILCIFLTGWITQISDPISYLLVFQVVLHVCPAPRTTTPTYLDH